ncbi:MAG TPA: UDP-N-acetylmuramate--L-alanine ligase [Candidatus Dormibacteraeota bacterium]|nr:UDP-N-acetylmuramate--L-alanine ligase [Candidatus Dormibacteraeota bacterium]
MRVHLMGVGGTQVSGLARVFVARGCEVSGCDVRESETTRTLAAEGVRVAIGHDPSHSAGQDLLVYSTAVSGAGLAEVEAARAAGARVLTRPEMLAELIAAAESVAVAGAHGKTTVTFMIGHVLAAAGLDPTVLVGDGLSSTAGASRWLVAEADESNGTLALHRPRHGVLTNVEFDHPDHFASVDEVDALFREYLAVVPGVAVVCADDERARAMPAANATARVTYGLAEDADYRCVLAGDERMFHVEHRSHGRLAALRLRLAGRHNVQNATAAFAMAVELGVAPDVAAAALAEFPGAHRRLERLGTWRGAAVYDDYGHHPTEVRATVAAARELGARRVLLVFQPHRFSRYQALRDDFADSLRAADAVVVTEIYPAGEANPGGVSAVELAMRVPRARFAADFGSARDHLEALVGEGDLVLLMGAGDIRRLGDELANAG